MTYTTATNVHTPSGSREDLMEAVRPGSAARRDLIAARPRPRPSCQSTYTCRKVHIKCSFMAEVHVDKRSQQQDEGPLGGLPPADRTLLVSAPLEVAIIEIRFTAEPSDISSSDAMRIRDVLSHASSLSFPRVEQALQQQMQVEFGPEASAQVRVQSRGWQFTSSSGRTQVTLMPQSLILQTSDYERWSTSIKAPLEALLVAVEKLLAPVLVQRTGLRYIDRFVDAACQSVADWEGKIDDTLLGPVRHPVLGMKIRAAQQQVELAIDDNHGALVRHGPVLDEATSRSTNYLLDIDVFNTSTYAFEVQTVTDQAERLNRTALSLFQAGVTPDYLRSMQLGEVR